MQRRAPGHSQTSRRFTFVGIALVLAVLLANGLAIGELRVEASDEVRKNTNNLGLLIAEQTANSMQAVDLVLRDIQGRLPDFSATAPDGFAKAVGTREFHEGLSRHLGTLPQTDVIIALDANGTMINNSRNWPMPGDSRFNDLSDRDYFTYLKAHHDRAAYVSMPVANRLTGQATIFIARRVNGPAGEFLGVLLGSMRLKYFRNCPGGSAQLRQS